MTLEVLVIAVVRIAGSLPVLRWPLAGGILAVLVDLSDLVAGAARDRLVLLTGLKELHEWALHGGRIFDGISSLEALEIAWRWLTGGR